MHKSQQQAPRQLRRFRQRGEGEEKSKAPTSYYMARQLKNCLNATKGRHNLSGRQIAEIINNQAIFKRHSIPTVESIEE